MALILTTLAQSATSLSLSTRSSSSSLLSSPTRWGRRGAHLVAPMAWHRSSGFVLRLSVSVSSSAKTDAMQQQPPLRQQQQQRRQHDNSALPVVLLKRNRQSKSFRDGSQLVFSGSIAHAPSTLRMGDLVQLQVPNNNKKATTSKATTTSTTTTASKPSTTLVGWGVFNPESMYRVRILSHSLLHSQPFLWDSYSGGSEKTNTEDLLLRQLLTGNLQRALQTRRAMGLPIAGVTDTYRLVNGEGDDLSGLAVDIIGDKVAVVMSSAAWCEIHQTTILECLQTLLPDHKVVWKTTPFRLKQDGYVIDDTVHDDDKEEPVVDDSGVGDAAHQEPVIALENGIQYQTFPFQKGQKTSVYCDQRVNRWNLAQYCSGKSVLDLCCYHGGFSLSAAKQGATSVVGVDSSQDAIDTCNVNAALNKMENIQFVKADIANFVKSCSDKFDVVVLDPPKLAPSVADLQRASRKYLSLNRDAIKLIGDEGGLFMSCTCSAAMTQKDGGQFFLQMVQQASLSAKRKVTLLSVSGAASCHTQSPVSYPAGNYLTAALFRVHPRDSEIPKTR